MAILEGGVRFPIDPFLLNTLRYYGLCPNQLPPIFYWIVSCVSRLNQMFGLQLDHHDINHMYSLCGNKRNNYYLKVRDMRVQLISCLPDSNSNFAREFVRVHGNWFTGEIPCPLSRLEVGSYRSLTCFSFQLWLFYLFEYWLTVFFVANGKMFTQDLMVVHVRGLNFVLKSKMFVHWNKQLRASHLILDVKPVYFTC